MSEAFYRKWRPRQWGEVIAQEHVVKTLQNAVCSGRIGHAYLFAGPRGTGKTTTARLLAKAVNCLDENLEHRPCNGCEYCRAVNEGRFLDLIEIDAASNTSVEDVRDLRDKINFAPTLGKYKVYIIDEVHMLSTAAFNALLKTLEEPPPHAIFILATTEIHKIPATILSRCQRHEFRRIPVAQIVNLLKDKAADENIPVDEDALWLIARQATGSMRDAISLLDQLSSTGRRVNLAEAQLVLGTATSQMVIDLTQAILSADSATGLNLVQTSLDAGTDARQFARQVVEYLRNLLLIRMNSGDQVEATPEIRSIMATQARQFGEGSNGTARLLEIIKLFNNAANDSRGGWQPGLQLELALVSAILVPDTPPVLTEAQPSAAINRPVTQSPVKAAPQESTPSSQPLPAAATKRPSADAGAVKSSPRTPAEPSTGPKSAPQPKDISQATPPAARDLDPKDSNAVEQAIRQKWEEIKKALKNNPSLQGLLNTSKIHSIREGCLVLSISSDILKSKLESNDNLKMISQVILTIVGVNLPIKVTTSAAKNPDMTTETGENSSLVNAAMDLGGKMVYKE